MATDNAIITHLEELATDGVDVQDNFFWLHDMTERDLELRILRAEAIVEEEFRVSLACAKILAQRGATA